MTRSALPLIAATFALAACGDGEQTAQSGDWLADVAAEAAAVPPPPPSPDWNEIPLSEHTFAEDADAFRSDVIEIPVGPNGGALEYKLALEEGDAITYTWTAEGLTEPVLFLSEFHGHTERVGDAPGTLMFYRREVGASESGMLVAPFTGIHGWYWKNDSAEPVTVRLAVAGFHEIIPGQ